MIFYNLLVLAFSMPISVMLIVLIMFIFFMFFVLPSLVVVISMASMLSTIVGHIDIVVPLVLHEIDRPVAGVVFAAVLAPFFLVSGGDMEVDRFLYDVNGSRADHDGLGVNHLGSRRVADINLSVKAGLADANGHVDIRGCGLC